MTDPRPVNINVVLERPGSNPPFRLTSNDVVVGPDNEITFANDKHPGFWIFFHLDNSNNPGYFFPNNPLAAMWSKTEDDAGRCPDAWQHWEQFFPKAVHKVKGVNTKLVVRNINGYETKFGYTLRVTKTPNDDDGDFLDLDPGGTNTNGPSSPLVNYLAVGAIAVTTGVLSALATVLLARPLFCS